MALNIEPMTQATACAVSYVILNEYQLDSISHLGEMNVCAVCYAKRKISKDVAIDAGKYFFLCLVCASPALSHN